MKVEDIERKDLLHEFFNHKSDASPLEASQQEELERDWELWIMGYNYEG